MRLFVFGMGFSARAVARALRAADPATTVSGTVRDLPGATESLPWRLHRFAGSADAAMLADLAEATHVLVSAPPTASGDPVLNSCRGGLDAAHRLEWIGYFSTVGVYGDHGGAWVDETAETRTTSGRGRERLTAEAAWASYAAARGLPLAILRLAGIYGPGRSSFDKLRDGTAHRLIKPGQVFNRIHVADIGRLTVLAATQRLAGIFNLADDLPAPPQDVVAHAAGLLGVPPPPEVPLAAAELSPMARSFYADNRRISNAAIKQALGVALLYPDYRQGLKAIIAEEQI